MKTPVLDQLLLQLAPLRLTAPPRRLEFDYAAMKAHGLRYISQCVLFLVLMAACYKYLELQGSNLRYLLFFVVVPAALFLGKLLRRFQENI